jgi:hypothetical protein
MRAGRALVAAEHALAEEGVAHAMVDGGDVDVALAGARAIVVPTSCGLDPREIEALARARKAGVPVILAPSLLLRDGSFRPLATKTAALLSDATLLGEDEAFDTGAVRARLAPLLEGVPRVLARPAPCAVTLHRSESGEPRVVFVINPSKQRQRVEVDVPGVTRIRDLLDGTTHELAAGVVVEGGSVRFCEVVSISSDPPAAH